MTKKSIAQKPTASSQLNFGHYFLKNYEQHKLENPFSGPEKMLSDLSDEWDCLTETEKAAYKPEHSSSRINALRDYLEKMIEEVKYPKVEPAPRANEVQINVFGNDFLELDHQREQEFRRLKSQLKQMERKMKEQLRKRGVIKKMKKRLDLVNVLDEFDSITKAAEPATELLKNFEKKLPLSNQEMLKKRMEKMELNEEQKSELVENIRAFVDINEETNSEKINL